jgi:hypothetical protein
MKSVKKEFWWDESNEVLIKRVWENHGATR